MNSITAAVCGTIAFLAVVSAYVVLSALHIDVTGFTIFLGTVAATSSSVFNNFRTAKVQEKVETIEQNTNGPLTETSAKVAEIHDAVVNK